MTNVQSVVRTRRTHATDEITIRPKRFDEGTSICLSVIPRGLWKQDPKAHYAHARSERRYKNDQRETSADWIWRSICLVGNVRVLPVRWMKLMSAWVYQNLSTSRKFQGCAIEGQVVIEQGAVIKFKVVVPDGIHSKIVWNLPELFEISVTQMYEDSLKVK